MAPDPHLVAEVFADLNDLKSPYLLGHSRAVAALSGRAAEQLRTATPRLFQVEVARRSPSSNGASPAARPGRTLPGSRCSPPPAKPLNGEPEVAPVVGNGALCRECARVDGAVIRPRLDIQFGTSQSGT